MICSRFDDNKLIRYNYTFLDNGKNVRIWNNNIDQIILYTDWLNEYYIVDKWRNI